MAIIRQKRKERFSIIDNRIIEDKRLSWGARGLLEYMLSKPDDWKFHMSELITHSNKDGRDKTYGFMDELKEYGYVTRKQKRNSNGKFGNQDLVVTDQPLTGFPYTAKPDTDSPDTVNPTLLNTDSTNTNKTNTDVNKHSASPSNALSVSTLKANFEKLWKDYPNKRGKREAFNHYKVWRKKSAKNTDDYLAKQLKKYLVYCEQNNSWYHPMNGSTWFNGRFDDVLVTDSITPNQFRISHGRRPTIQEKMPEWSKKDEKELNKKASPEDIAKLKARIANRKKVSS
ncbi:hypothetical protein [Lactobacillus taiwanensis]|uniref:hypothetical protein n=1 Tax=Lactobacillus taiwanensis TaxID=508451 RepID=UPI0025A9F8D7|nr:hypothetical protein [Lactobacillus taiwanensis]